ncbi:MAG: hypothetical protein FWG79_07340 [Bacteroidales bacterium]|nr:hypothetical protein [Bacteroidales bacterium]
MKKLIFILILIAAFATKSFAHCPIPQWCPEAPLHQTLCPGESIEEIEFPSVIGKTLVITWWTDGTRFASIKTPDGITVSGDASTPLGDREYAWPVSIKGAPTDIGTHHYTVSNTCGVELLHGSITLNALPTIGMVTPTIDQTTALNIAFDSTLTLTAEPAGTPPITIQWYSSTTATSSGGSPVSDATGNTFAPPSATVNTDGVYYYAVATDGCGSTATTDNTSGKHIVGPACTPWIGATGCNNNALTFTLGTPTFVTNTTWQISGNGITQEWSDAVIAPGCAKGNTTNIDEYANSVAVADCRQARQAGVGFLGHYFSWCMVHRFAAQLCPGDWRVPSCQDFVNLDVALGGTGDDRSVTNDDTSNGWTGTDANEKYTGTATGTWGGFRFTASANFLTSPYSAYWSYTQSSATDAYYHRFDLEMVNPQFNFSKARGFAVRCVRDN